MGFHFHFKELQDRSELRDLIDFMILQGLNYPRYEEWVERTEYELDTGYKHAILAFSEGTLVGNLVYQQHKKLPRFLELKNLRIHRRLRVRDFGRFMLRQVEVEGRIQNDAIICDVRADQSEVIRFFERCDYDVVALAPLYDPHSPEVTLLKTLNRGSQDDLIVAGKDYIDQNRL